MLSCVFLTLVSINPFCAMASRAQSGVSAPIVVLEATRTAHEIGGYQSKELFLRLTEDGKVEWDKLVGKNAWERQTGSVSAKEVTEIERTLRSVNQNLFGGNMGPYFVYVDSSVELRVRMTAKRRQLTFLLMNPWSPGGAGKRMPKDVKTVVCEIDTLHAQVANEPVNEMCKATNPPR